MLPVVESAEVCDTELDTVKSSPPSIALDFNCGGQRMINPQGLSTINCE